MVRVAAIVAGPAVFVLSGLALHGAQTLVDGPTPFAPAVVAGALTLPAVLLLARRAARSRSESVADVLALRRPRAALTGAAVIAGSAAVVIGADTLAGGVRIVAVDLATLAGFLALNTLLALLLEALPEELTFRGLALGELARRGSMAFAGTVTTALFALGIPLGIALVDLLVGDPVRLAPAGQRPVDYLILLALFGTVLALLRVLTRSLWACVVGHVVFLTVNRVLLGWPGTGVVVELPVGGELLVPIYLVLASLVLAVALSWRRRVGREVPDTPTAPR